MSNQPQTAEESHAPTKAASTENTWQRAGLQQDELMQKSILNHKLTPQESYGHELGQVEKEEEARDEKRNNSLIGTILGGPLIGT